MRVPCNYQLPVSLQQQQQQQRGQALQGTTCWGQRKQARKPGQWMETGHLSIVAHGQLGSQSIAPLDQQSMGCRRLLQARIKLHGQEG